MGVELMYRPAPSAGQPPTAPPGGGFTPTRGRGLPSDNRKASVSCV